MGFSDLWDFFKFESFYFQEFLFGIIELSGQIIIVLFGMYLLATSALPIAQRKYEVLIHYTLYVYHISYIILAMDLLL
jgi:hypothetical protein